MKKSKKLKKLILVLTVVALAGTAAVSFAGCGATEDKAAANSQEVAVQRGNLSLEITAAGNLALSTTQDLPVELFYGQSGSSGTKGTIGEVLVEEGDLVEEGQVLVTMDKEEWNDQLSALEETVTARERALVQAQISLQTAQQALKSSRDSETTRKLAVMNAEISLENARTSLNESISATDFELAVAELNKAKTYYNYIQNVLPTIADADDYLLTQEKAQEKLDAAQIQYDNVLSGYDSEQVALKKKQVEIAGINLTLAQKNLTDLDQEIELKAMQIPLSQGNLQDAEKALEDAKEDLAEAENKSPEIRAPFAGFITRVNVAGGDEVLNGTVAVQIADPDKFEADILVSEMDIMQVELGGEASVTLDSLTGVSLPAKVTHISPTATIQSGVVNYSVTVEVDSTSATAAGTQLREGLTVTVSIIIEQKTDVLLVPNSAITSQGGQSYVQVLSATGAAEMRAIKTGITDYVNTEVTEGLSLGEKVVIQQSSGTSTSTQQQQGGMMIPGMGGPPPGGG